MNGSTTKPRLEAALAWVTRIEGAVTSAADLEVLADIRTLLETTITMRSRAGQPRKWASTKERKAALWQRKKAARLAAQKEEK